MNAEASAAVAFVAAAAVTVAVTPAAIALARRLDFLDHPREYRKHAAATPFLGSTAVLAGFLVAALAVGSIDGKHVLIACAIGMWIIGTLDDRFAVAPVWRLLAEAAATAAMVSAGIGWHASLGGIPDFVLSVLWVVGLVNAFNLMDNLDGACSTVGCVCATGIGTVAAIHSAPALAGVSFAIAGACAGFLRWNLSSPARIFLGDGGSMPIGLMIAALSMGTVDYMHVGDAKLLAGGLLVGLPIFDTALVSVSRSRRGVTLLTGGRDHLTHRLLLVLRSPRQAAVALAVSQALLSALVIASDQLGTVSLAVFASAMLIGGMTAIAVLDSEAWRPSGIATTPRTRKRGASPPHPGASQVAGSSLGADPQ